MGGGSGVDSSLGRNTDGNCPPIFGQSKPQTGNVGLEKASSSKSHVPYRRSFPYMPISCHMQGSPSPPWKARRRPRRGTHRAAPRRLLRPPAPCRSTTLPSSSRTTSRTCLTRAYPILVPTLLSNVTSPGVWPFSCVTV